MCQNLACSKENCSIEYGECYCGCGEKTTICGHTRIKGSLGHVYAILQNKVWSEERTI